MADSYTQVAPDSTGAKIQTTTKTVNAQTVHRQVMTVASARTRTGLYRVVDNTAGGISTATASTALATTAGSGLLILANPVASTVAVSIKSMQLSFSTQGTTTTATSPRIQANRFAFTGTISSTALTAAPRVRTAVAGQAADATAQGKAYTGAITGQTTTASSVIGLRSWLVPGNVLLTSGLMFAGQTYIWDPDLEDEEIILAAGEGFAIQQMDAGTTSDVRRVSVSLAWEEFTAP